MKIVKLMRTLGVLCFALMIVPFFMAIMGIGEFDTTNSGSFYSIVNAIGGWHMIGFGMMGLGFLLFFGGSAVNGILNQRVMSTGVDALARITGISETGEMVNESPVLDFTLDVRPGTHPSFTGHCRQKVSLAKLGSYRIGGAVGVRFIPGDDKVVIVGAAADENQFGEAFSKRSAPAAFNSATLETRNRSRLRYYLTIAGVIILPIAVISFIGYVLLLSSKHTAEYACAVSNLKENPKAIEMFGEPLEFGFVATGNVTGSGSSRSAHFETAASGPKGEGKLNFKSFRMKDGYSTMKITLTMGDEKTDVYDDVYPCK